MGDKQITAQNVVTYFAHLEPKIVVTYSVPLEPDLPKFLLLHNPIIPIISDFSLLFNVDSS